MPVPSDAAVQEVTAALAGFVGNDSLTSCTRIILQAAIDAGELVPKADHDAAIAQLQANLDEMTQRALAAEAARAAAGV